ELTYKTDSLQRLIAVNERYYESIKKVLQGEISSVDFNRDSILEEARINVSEIDLRATKEDSLLREKVAKEDNYNLFETATSKINLLLFPPVTVTISAPYNFEKKHCAVDIIVESNTPIKATADGTIIFAEWIVETGNVIIIDHSD